MAPISTPAPALALLSASPFNRGIVAAARQRGLQIIAIDRNATLELDHDHHVRVDVLDYPEIIRQLAALTQCRIIGAYTSADIAVRATNEINRHFCGRAVPEALLDAILSKETMTAAWRRDGLLNRFSQAFAGFSPEILPLVAQFDVIIKPDDSSSSRGITILDRGASSADVEAAVAQAKAASTDGRVLVEEFVQGRELTVEMLGDDAGHVAVYGISLKTHTENTIRNKIAVRLHYNPPELDDAEQARIAEFARACFRSFGLRNSMGHLEVLRKPDGTLSPVEINSRSAGFVACPLVDEVSGRSYVADYLAMLGGAPVADTLFGSDRSAMYFFYDLPAGSASQHAVNLTEFLPDGIVSLYHNRTRLAPGNRYALLTCDNDRYGFEILAGPRALMTSAAIAAAEVTFLGRLLGPARGGVSPA